MSGFITNVDVDFIRNGIGRGEMASAMTSGQYVVNQDVGFDSGLLRPVFMPDGQTYCYLKTGRMVTNDAGKEIAETEPIPLQRLINRGLVPTVYNTSALSFQAWQMIDRAVQKATRAPLDAWNDLAAANTYGGFDGMSVTGLIKDTMTDPGEAKVDMDTLTDDFSDAPRFTPDILPLPIIHCGARMSQRRLAQSRRSGTALDTTMIEQCGRRCGELLENITIGETDLSSFKIGQDVQQKSSDVFTNQGIYGFRTQPNRITKTDITAPNASLVVSTLVDEIIAMVELARQQGFYGPFVLYPSSNWDQYFAWDYWRYVTSGGAAPSKTVLQRVQEIRQIQRVAFPQFFNQSDSTAELLLVEMTSQTVRAVDGMDWTTVQWTSDGGAQLMLRVMGIKVPDLRCAYVGTDVTAANRVCGIVHGTTS
jgi:hypothetical protein